MIGAEIEGSPPGGVLFRTSRTRDPEIQAHGAKLTRPPTYGRFLSVSGRKHNVTTPMRLIRQVMAKPV